MRDLFALSSDYRADDRAAQLFFAETQNKLLFAVTGQTAACNQLRHLDGGALGDLAEKMENLLRLHHSALPALISCESVGWAPCRGGHLELLLEAMLDRRMIEKTMDIP